MEWVANVREMCQKVIELDPPYAKRRLRRGEAMCAEGAFCEVSGVGRRELCEADGEQVYAYRVPFDRYEHTGVAPSDVWQKMYGIPNFADEELILLGALRDVVAREHTELFEANGAQYHNVMALTTLNDTYGFTAKQVAELMIMACDQLEKR